MNSGMTDAGLPTTGLEIMVEDTWFPADPATWRAWTGQRRVWGQEYHGPVYAIDAPSTAWSGKRICNCSACQSTVSPGLRLN